MITRRKFVRTASIGAASLMLAGCSSSGADTPAADDELLEDAPNATTEETTPTQAADSASSNNLEQISDTRFYFDTVCTVTGTMTAEILEEAFARCEFFENTLSAHTEGTDVDRINHADGRPVEVAPETAELVSRALDYCQVSDGAFDITIGTVSLLWDFIEGVVPDAQAIAEALPHIDYTQVRVEGTTVQLLDPQAKLDLGGIAKGYIADDLIAFLESQGVQSAFVNLGGNVKTLGVRPDGTPWRVGIQDPNGSTANADDIVAVVPSQGTSVVTSGLYERTFESNGERYWHILDPATGYPVDAGVVSASIVSTASIDGDGFTKPLFVKGIDYAKQFFTEHPDLQGLIVGSDGQIWKSEGAQIELVG